MDQPSDKQNILSAKVQSRGNILSYMFMTEVPTTTENNNFSDFKAASAFFYCAYYLRIFSSMFCGEITTNRRRLYRFRVFRIADLKTSQTKRFRVNLQNIATKRTILLEISYLIIAQTLVK